MDQKDLRNEVTRLRDRSEINKNMSRSEKESRRNTRVNEHKTKIPDEQWKVKWRKKFKIKKGVE